MITKFLVITLSIAIACGCLPTSAIANDNSDWGNEVRGLRLKIETPKNTYKIGEEILVTFTFTNVSAKSFTVMDITDVARSIFHGFEFTDITGQKIAQEPPDVKFDEKAPINSKLEPQETIHHQVVLNYWKLAGLGHAYTRIGEEARILLVTGVYTTPEGYTFSSNGWTGILKSMPIRIQITE